MTSTVCDALYVLACAVSLTIFTAQQQLFRQLSSALIITIDVDVALSYSAYRYCPLSSSRGVQDAGYRWYVVSDTTGMDDPNMSDSIDITWEAGWDLYPTE